MNESFKKAHEGALVADALSMPVHWYYDRDALRRDYGKVDRFMDPLPHHADSILWRSEYEPLNEKADILHDQAQYWGQRGVHYHQFLKAGENTVNYQLGEELRRQVKEEGAYDSRRWAERYVEVMRTPGWHRDTYLEEYHRGFFNRYAAGKDLLKCGIRDEHIGGLSQIPALLSALPGDLSREEVRQTVRDHVTLTHRHSNVLRAADCLVRLLWTLADGKSLGEAVMAEAGDWFSTKRAKQWLKHPDEVVVGQKLSPACYIAEAFPAALYLAWKYGDEPEEGLVANAMVGGDSCHRGAVIGALLGAEATGLRKAFT